ncbi:MAG: DEAD/DEAH box helicase [SAR324 cluster bacterium]|nr:DEAD/DEAH box helicase [SAR324 cluster bacterium]
MDIFKTHHDIVQDYQSYIRSFINIKDDQIRETVERELEKGRLWPDPLIQFNPSFEDYGEMDDLVKQGILHTEIKDIFAGYKLYKHQVEAIRLGVQYRDFVVTSGTGSGKSLAYIGSIFNHLLKNRNETGIRAIIIYPMNALINSQTEEFEKYKKIYEEQTGKDFPVTFGQYTGQEKEERREELRQHPPDILLTNYMMMELLLTRMRERSIRDSIYANLKYLVFDELHTYRGRQGADVSLLIRRIKAKCQQSVTCIGTSATMVSGGTILEQKQQVAQVASTIFGTPFEHKQIIGETLTRSFQYSGQLPSSQALIQAVHTSVDESGEKNSLTSHPTAIWLENHIALAQKEGILVRNAPMRFPDMIQQLVDITRLPYPQCKNHLESLMRWISNVNENHQKSRYTYLPFKLHQFFSQTGSVYTTLDQNEQRLITLEPGIFASGNSSKKPIFSNVFSRFSGHAFICVTKNDADSKFEPREFRENDDEEDGQTQAGYLVIGDDVWNPDEDLEQLPEAWVKFSKTRGRLEPGKKHIHLLPQRVYFDEYGNFSERSDTKPWPGWFMPQPLLFDPTAGVFFDTKTNEGTKLTKLGSEGRSTSTTITAFSILRQLEQAGFPREDQKLLSFTDNRQDAALQSGHFNDFINVVRLRSAIYTAIKSANDQPLTYKNLGEAIFKAINLPFLEYANTETVPGFPNVRRKYEEALQLFLIYRALYDLRRGWRVILPNLEQCALLEIDYEDLDEITQSEEGWASTPFLNSIAPSTRKELVFHVLEFFRREYAIYSSNYLTDERIKENKKEIEEKLKAPWKLESRDQINPYHLRLETLQPNSGIFTKSIGLNSTLGKYLRRFVKEHDPDFPLKGTDYKDFMKQFLETLESAGFLISRTAKNLENEETRIYQLRLDKILWKKGDHKMVQVDVVKQRSYKEITVKPNRFFQTVYLTNFSSMKKLYGQDHTGQLNSEDRIDREEKFRDGTISALFCSPTMELGIDIKNLSVVHLRNSPPNPANYAQRGGRAGRSGQAALVFTYCSTYSNHDRHYFNNQTHLVAGAVAPPRIDLCNRELLLSHLNALFLSEVGCERLNESLIDLLDETKDTLPLSQTTKEQLKINVVTYNKIKNTFKQVIDDFKNDLSNGHTHWFSEQWIDHNLNRVIDNLDDAMDRWRKLFQAAKVMLRQASQKIESGLYTHGSPEYKEAKRHQDQSTWQLGLLKNESMGRRDQLSEFYPYRYLASEGFLPGYNFTRLPLRTFVPKGDAGEYISRPRLIALREFGPRNVIYHKGSKYEIKQLLIQNAENSLIEAKVSKNSGYFLSGSQKDLEICPFSGVDLSDNDNKLHFVHLLEMTETRTEERDRISCEEEERVSKGFQINTYFSVDDGDLDKIKKCRIKNDQDTFLNIRFIPAARLIQVNSGWRASNSEGFHIGLISGQWKSARQLENRPDDAEEVRAVKLFTTTTADALYIEPIQSLSLEWDGIITLQYALKRAIENMFQVESSEISVVIMGDPEHPNIFIYESSEGSLGILSQFVQDKNIFRKVVDEAIRVCRFDDEDYKDPASYDDLLSYYNQRDHKDIDRFLIQDALNKLRVCEIELLTTSIYDNYDAHYEALKQQIDPNSATERVFLDFIFQHDLRLPDAAQKRVEGIYVQPDFFYEPNLWVFCDGTPHDNQSVKDEDEQKRQAIWDRGHEVFVYYYKDKLAEIIAARPDIFKKVR